MTKNLKSLQKFNQERQEYHDHLDDPRPNGIACPKCGGELIDSSPGLIITTNPGLASIHCPSDDCDYVGTRLA